jgi:hypothetical protein
MAEENVDPVGPAFALEYVTSAVSMQPNDGIVVHVVNDSGVAESTRVVIYRNRRAPNPSSPRPPSSASTARSGSLSRSIALETSRSSA